MITTNLMSIKTLHAITFVNAAFSVVSPVCTIGGTVGDRIITAVATFESTVILGKQSVEMENIGSRSYVQII